MIQEVSTEGRFSCPYFSGQYDETLPTLNTVEDLGEGIFMLGAGKEKPGIGCKIKGGFLKIKKLFVHLRFLLQ
jgi:hypothetical protein